MNFSLTPNLEQFVRDRANSGDYNNASEVVREALRLLKRHEEIQALKLQKLKQALQEAETDMENGDFTDLKDPADLDRLFAEL